MFFVIPAANKGIPQERYFSETTNVRFKNAAIFLPHKYQYISRS